MESNFDYSFVYIRIGKSYVPIDRFLPVVVPVRMFRGKISFGHERWLYLRVILAVLSILAILAILAILTIVLNIIIVVTVVIRITIVSGTALSSAS